MLITKPGDEIAVVPTLNFTDAAQRRQFHEYANTPDGLSVAHGLATFPKISLKCGCYRAREECF